jgi:hypothetical protein
VLQHITDHVEQAEDLLLEQYKNKPRTLALLRSFIRRCQELEDAAWEVLLQRFIDNAVGAQLDMLGRIVGQDLDGVDDETYRVYIKARIRVNRSHGRPDDVIDVLRLIETAAFIYSEQYPATAVVLYEEPSTAPDVALVDLLGATRAGGTALFLLAGDSGADDHFLWADVGDNEQPADDAAHGFADTDTPDEGGKLKNVLRA